MIAFDQGMNIISQMIVFSHWSYEVDLKYDIAFTFFMSEDFFASCLSCHSYQIVCTIDCSLFRER